MSDQKVHLEELTNLKRRACSREKLTFSKGQNEEPSTDLARSCLSWIHNERRLTNQMIHVATSNQKLTWKRPQSRREEIELSKR
jgi:hypothetical protein